MASEEDIGTGGINTKQLLSVIERLERLEEEKKALSSDMKDIYSEAKGSGYDTKIIKWLIAQRKKDPADRDNEEQLRMVYARAIKH